MRAPGGGASCLGVGRPGSGASPFPTARPLRRAARARYPLAVGPRGAGVLNRHQPHSARSCELALRAVWAARGRPGGAPLAWVWGVRGRALSDFRPPVLWGVQPGPTTHWLWVRGLWAWGPVTHPTARALASWLCALWGGHEGARGAPLAWVGGFRGRALSHPRLLVLWGVRPGPTTHWLWVRGVRAWGPVTNPTACALASWLSALWGRHESAPGGCLLPGCGASGVGRCPIPDRPSFGACGRGPLPTGCGCEGCGRGDPSPTPQRALLRAGFARCGGGTRAPRGGASCLDVGRPRSGALPFPTARPLGRAAGAHYPLAVGAGGVGVRTRHQPPARALASWLCALWGRHEGARGGGACCLRVGRPGSGALPFLTARPPTPPPPLPHRPESGRGGAPPPPPPPPPRTHPRWGATGAALRPPRAGGAPPPTGGAATR